MKVVRSSLLRMAAGLAAALASVRAFAQDAPPPAPTPEPAPPPMAAPAAAPSQTSNYFNPSIAVIGNFLGIAGHNPVDNQDSLQLRESELSLQAIVDPYARGDFFISFSNDSVVIEEGYVTFLHLPWDLLVKVGQFKVAFGKINTMHLHTLPWPDEPLPMINLLGTEDGWNDVGISMAKLLPLPGDTFSEATVQVLRGKTEGIFDAPSRGKLAVDAQYRLYRDFGDDNNVELGFSYGQGWNGSTEDARTTLENTHLVYRWKPLQGRPYRSFILRSEYYWSQREQPEGKQNAQGFYVSGDYQLAKRWFTGLRYEFSDHADNASLRDRGEAVTLTFWPSEFSQVRGEFRQR
ncbi:MAG TPA: hypothetical protein VMQ61_07970, partial [Thermoanaerobaculia bacterium]|nr:hypothetical protein [Thermoanaerobaculia bacterium]